jgi:thiamine pyrophosphate-dependent acetolactate synthase large subunit-like protein
MSETAANPAPGKARWPVPIDTSLALADVARIVTEERAGAVAVTGPGAFAGQLYVADPDSASLYNMELAYSTSTALGLAVGLPNERVIAVEGDGSLLAALGVLATIARYRPPNLAVVILVNGIYGTGDNSVQTQTGFGGDLGAVALALGWDRSSVLEARDPKELRRALARARDEPGPWLIQAFVDPRSYAKSAGRPRPGIDVAESGVLLRRELERRRRSR